MIPVRNLVYFLLEFMTGRRLPRSMKKQLGLWRALLVAVLGISIVGHWFTVKEVLSVRAENKDLRRRNTIVMNNNKELLEITSRLHQINNKIMQFEMDIILAVKDNLNGDTIRSLEERIDDSMILQTQSIIEAQKILEDNPVPFTTDTNTTTNQN